MPHAHMHIPLMHSYRTEHVEPRREKHGEREEKENETKREHNPEHKDRESIVQSTMTESSWPGP